MVFVAIGAVALAACATAPAHAPPTPPERAPRGPIGTHSPYAIAPGKDGALWYTEYQGDGIGRIQSNGSIMRFKIDPSGFAQRITAGPDGAMWFTDTVGNRIGRVQGDDKVAYVKLPRDESGPNGITTGEDGNLWFTEPNGKIARVTTQGQIVEFIVATVKS